MAAIEQLLHGARKWPVVADRLQEMRVKIIGWHVGVGAEPAAPEDAQQVCVRQACAHDGALDMISQLAEPEATPLRQTAELIGNGCRPVPPSSLILIFTLHDTELPDHC